MNMVFRRDYRHFRLNRDEVGDCTIDIRLYHLGMIPYWFRFLTTPHHFVECLGIIKDWCCNADIGKAIIHDPNSVNTLVTIKYRQYKGEVLNELKQ